MHKLSLALASVLGLLAATNSEAALTLNFAANTGSSIQFVGAGTSSTFSLTPNSNPQFTVTSTTGGNGSGVGVTGSVVSSTGFTYQQSGITTSGSLQTAALSGTGTLTLQSGTETVTATIAGVDISTFGTTGGTNSTGTINLSNLSLSGGTANADLTAFYNQAIAGGGIASLSFQFIPAMSLTQLLNGVNTTSYSGTITATAVPEPATFAMALSAIPVFWLVHRRHRKNQQS